MASYIGRTWRTIPGACRRITGALLLCALCFLVAPASTLAGPLDREVEFHIPEGSLAIALLQVSTQANVPITVAPHATDNLRSLGVIGRFSVGSALERLLRDTGLSVGTIGDTVTILRTASAGKASPALSSATETPARPEEKRN